MAEGRPRYALRSAGALPGDAKPSATPNLVSGYRYRFILDSNNPWLANQNGRSGEGYLESVEGQYAFLCSKPIGTRRTFKGQISIPLDIQFRAKVSPLTRERDDDDFYLDEFPSPDPE